MLIVILQGTFISLLHLWCLWEFHIDSSEYTVVVSTVPKGFSKLDTPV